MTPHPLRTCTVDLTCDLAAPRTARRLLGLLLPQWGVDDPDALDSASIVVSELVTNVLVHCDDGGPLTLTAELEDGLLRLAVTDREPSLPQQRRVGEVDENGRGLSIVTQIASRLEVVPTHVGKQVRVELPVPSACCA